MSARGTYRTGRSAEAIAAWLLRLKGFRILAQRYAPPVGEIDLIARRGRTVAFVEVKWRATVIERDRAIDQFRLRRVGAAAEAVAHRYASPHDTVRIDVLLLAPRRWPRHIVNAWQP